MNKLNTLRMWRVLLMTATLLLTFGACSDDDDIIIPTITIHSPALYINTPSTTATVRFTTSKAVSVSVNSLPKGWSVEADIRTGIITVISPAADDAEAEDSGTVVVYAYSSSSYSSSATLFISRETPIDLSEQRSNCYIITRADQTYKIPVTRKGESDEEITPASVGLVWQTPGTLLSFVECFEEGFLTFRPESDGDGEFQPGNALVAAYDKSGEILWTWHLWFTSTEPAEVGGYMDRNLGANYTLHGSNEEILRSYGTYYQWGRLTPFVPPAAYNCADSRDAYMYSASSSTVYYLTYELTTPEVDADWAVSNPMVYLLGDAESNYNWCYPETESIQTQNNFWSGAEKGLYDPCPKGWRVAENFTGLSLADDLSTDLSTLERQYGWTLTNGQEEIFFPACGRRSWLRGLITNVNDTTVPKPWIGYYWTRSVAEEQAEAMYFSLDTEDPSASELVVGQPQWRANGMQVRCVRE